MRLRSSSSQPPMAVPMAELSAAGRRFDDVEALEGVTLEVAAGSLVGVIGPSGAGKTTIVRLLTGGLRATSGTVRVMGEDPTRLRARTRQRIGFLPQNESLYDALTVAENLDFVGSLFGLGPFARRRRIRAILRWLDLEDAHSRLARNLSGGMRRRLQLGCALIHDPDLVLLDEPTAGVDPIVRQAIWAELRRLRDVGRTLIVTTQIVTEAEECDTVALVAAGRLVACASPEELRRHAFGGDLIEVATSDMVEVEVLGQVPGIDEVRRRAPRLMTLVAQDAAIATPAVVSAVEAAGASVTSIQTLRPSFDEVFVKLVERADDTGREASDPATRAPGGPTGDGTAAESGTASQSGTALAPGMATESGMAPAPGMATESGMAPAPGTATEPGTGTGVAGDAPAEPAPAAAEPGVPAEVA
jgi:ABC-2 type transport system ATP-binding protein